MSAADLATEVLLALCVVTTVVCCFALVILRDFYERLHYMASVTTVGTGALLAAVVVTEGWGQATIKAIFVFFLLLLVNAVLTHATARAARVREFGHWTPEPEEEIQGAHGSRHQKDH
jgi:monovalent cation/proton antiporter MnhG/PhaG subunit